MHACAGKSASSDSTVATATAASWQDLIIGLDQSLYTYISIFVSSINSIQFYIHVSGLARPIGCTIWQLPKSIELIPPKQQ